MDVDDLGKLFQEGLGKKNASISRVASVSFLLRLFFEGWLNEICAEFNPSSQGKEGDDTLYAIYAGGDDLFIAGAWSAIPEVARRIHLDFSAFTCHNPKVHISAGIAVEDPHAPLYQLAQESYESLEGHAKRWRENGHEKNAIHFLGRTMAWNELEATQTLCEQLKNLVSGEVAPRALLHLVMALHYSYQRVLKERPRRRSAPKGPEAQAHYGPWMWQAAYFLSRMIQRLGGRASPVLLDLKNSLTDAQRLAKELPRAALAARWAELLTRREEEQTRRRT